MTFTRQCRRAKQCNLSALSCRFAFRLMTRFLNGGARQRSWISYMHVHDARPSAHDPIFIWLFMNSDARVRCSASLTVARVLHGRAGRLVRASLMRVHAGRLTLNVEEWPYRCRRRTRASSTGSRLWCTTCRQLCMRIRKRSATLSLAERRTFPLKDKVLSFLTLRPDSLTTCRIRFTQCRVKQSDRI